MNILNREELCKLIKDTKCIDSDIVQKDISVKYDRNSSAIQPCSIDLHIGEMYIPEKKDSDLGGKTNPNKKEIILKPGGSLLVRIEENINLPTDIGGICFAPARLSLRGMLIVNIGHIDPGFSGKLHFTVINLGKGNLSFRKGDTICTLLLFKLSKHTDSFGSEENVTINGISVSKTIHDNLPLLSSTFMDFENTTQKTVKKEVSKANIRLPIIIAALTVGLPLLGTFFLNFFSYNDKLEKRIEQLEAQVKQIDSQVDIEKRISDLENIINNSKQAKPQTK